MGARLILACLVELEGVHAEFLKEQAGKNNLSSITDNSCRAADEDLKSNLTQEKEYDYNESPVAGLIEDVVVMGTPVSVDSKWDKARNIVSGRFINCFSKHDWTLGVLYRTQRFSSTVAGIREVPSHGIENCDVSSIIKSHTDYSSNISEILDLACLADDAKARKRETNAADTDEVEAGL